MLDKSLILPYNSIIHFFIMIKSIITIAALAVGMPAQAGLVILPNLYAREYCNLRALGVSVEDSRRAAMSESTIDGEPVKVTLNGRQVDLDVIKASQAVADRCPQYLD